MGNKSRKYGIANIDYIHDIIHRGLFFSVVHTFKSVADEAYAYMRISTGDTEIHPFIGVAATGLAYFAIYRDANVSGGTPLLITHHKDETDRRGVLDCAFYHTPSVDSNPGTLWMPERLIQGGTGPKTTGGATGLREELYFKEDTEYLIAVQNNGGAAKDIEIELGFYPHDIVE